MDFILNGTPHGPVASRLLENNFDVGILRPYKDEHGRHVMTINAGKKDQRIIAANAPATLRKDEWVLLDQAIVKAARDRLRAVSDLRDAGLTYMVPNGLSKTILETERQSDDVNPAILSMDGLRENENERPHFDIKALPLPIVHKDFSFSARQLATSRNGGSPLDTTLAEMAARRVAEKLEGTLVGTETDYSYGGGTIQGYTTFTNRNTRTITAPTAGGWTGATTLTDVLQMRKLAYDDKHYGPYMLYASPDWDVYLDGDFSTAKGDISLRQRILQIQGISGLRTLDKLGSGYKLLLVQMTSDVVRLVVGMEITVVQWESHGGMQQNFKVMGIIVPQIRADFNSNCGIVHGST